MAREVKIARLRRTLLLYATAGAFLIGLFASLMTLVPLSSRLKASAADGLMDTARGTAQSVAALVEGRHKAIGQISSRTRARTLLEAFNDDKLSLPAYADQTRAILADAMASTEDIRGVTRVALDGKAMLSVGEEVDAALWPTDWDNSPGIRVVGPVDTPMGQRVIAISPIERPTDRRRLGTDVVVLDGKQVTARLQFGKARSGGSSRVYLLYHATDGARLLLADGSSERLADRKDLPGDGILEAVAGLNPELLEDDDLLIAGAPVGINRWGVVVTRNSAEVFAGVNNDIMLVMLGVFVLALAGAGGLYLILRPVTGTLLVHADSMEQAVARATLDLSQAMGEAEQAREEAERAFQQLQRTQATLIQAEKMASLGGLVAGIAHEINTPVGIVLTGASFLQKETDKLQRLYHAEALSAEEMEDYLAAAGEAARLIQGNATRAADLIHSFKQVAVDQTAGERRLINLHEYITEVLTSLRPTLKKRPIVVTVAVPDGLMVDTYPGAISQLLTNLIVNTLTHAYENNHTKGRITITAADDGDQVDLIYEDDGRGIPAELHRRVFEPFFTTRRDAGGSGLGLHIVFNLVSRTLGGTVRLESPGPRGCRFVIRFPKIPPPQDTPPA